MITALYLFICLISGDISVSIPLAAILAILDISWIFGSSISKNRK